MAIDHNDARDNLAQLREHMEVVGSDGQTVGTIDKVRGDKVILTKNSQGGVHRSFDAAAIARIDGDRVMLGQTAEEAKRGLVEEAGFEEHNSGDLRTMSQPLNAPVQTEQNEGPHNLERSFSGTYPDKG